MMKRKIIKYIAFFFSFLIVLVAGAFLLRDNLLCYLTECMIEKMAAEKKVSISCFNLHAKGINGIKMDSLKITPQGKETLLKTGSLVLTLDLWKLVAFNLHIEEIKGEDVFLTLINNEGHTNYRFLFDKEGKQNSLSTSDYGAQTNHLVRTLFRFLPLHMHLQKVYVSYTKDSIVKQVRTADFQIKDQKISTLLEVSTKAAKQHYRLHGAFCPSQETFSVHLEAPDGGSTEIPLPENWGTTCSFRTLSFELKKKRLHHFTRLSGHSQATGVILSNPRLASEPVSLQRLFLKYELEIGKEYVELGNSSTLGINQLDFQPSLRVQKEGEGKAWKFTMRIDKPFFPASQLFSSIPKGTFESLEGLQASGELAYHFLLDVDLNNPDSLRLESELSKRNFRITDFGRTKLHKLGGPFLYTAYENGVPVRTFNVGSEHPGFLPLEEISPLLRAAVLHSEDGSFFSHRGFRMDALQEALVHDLKVKRFARGGSTISMQLVKNVFLSRDKNLLRKLEEALITWLIEEERLVSKPRMYEIYLTICEWGPGVYGAREACHFYFAKEPAQLTPEEAIFLAALIPSPKRYRSLFTEEQELRPWLKGYFQTLARLLARNGLITQEQADSIRPSSVKLTGPAANFLRTNHTPQENSEPEASPLPPAFEK